MSTSPRSLLRRLWPAGVAIVIILTTASVYLYQTPERLPISLPGHILPEQNDTQWSAMALADDYQEILGQEAEVPLTETELNLKAMREQCELPDEFQLQYGRVNLRMTRGYEGSRYRIERFIEKILRGEEVLIGAIGGSVTTGYGAYADRWTNVMDDWLAKFFPFYKHRLFVWNGAVGASGSDYFSYCFHLHIPREVDLVFVEQGINDAGEPEYYETMENLLRGLLSLETKPAVIVVDVLSLRAEMGGSGGRMHLPVAQYLDVPVINQRLPLLPHFSRFPELLSQYFLRWNVLDEEVDLRHLNARGHKDLSNILSSFIRDVTCDMVSNPGYKVGVFDEVQVMPVQNVPGMKYDAQLAKFDPELIEHIQSDWPQESRQFTHEPDEKEREWYNLTEGNYTFPGFWLPPTELGLLPRLRVMEKWDEDITHQALPLRPTCLSIRSPDPRFNLTPTANSGWSVFAHEEHPDKPYLIPNGPGAQVSFQLETRIGIVKMYALKSATYGLGKALCWVDDADEGVVVNGYWKNEWLNIGQFTTLALNLPPGMHTITCEQLDETDDPTGANSFRMLSIMSL